MREHYKSYAENIEIEVELEIDELTKEFAWLFSLFIKFDRVNASSESQIDFAEMKENIIQTLEKNGLVKYVGERFVDGWVELYFYALDSKNLFKKIEKDLLASKFLFEQSVVRDTRWEFYTTNLLPNEMEVYFLESQKIIALLKDEGDDLTQEREVEHYAMFDTDSQKQRFLDAIVLKGFTFKDDLATQECAHGVALIKKHALDDESITEVVKELYESVKKEHGYYELWSTTLVEKE